MEKYKKITMFLVVILSSTMLFAGCNSGSSTSSTDSSGGKDYSAVSEADVTDKRVGTVKITSGGQEIVPVGYKVFELYKGGAADDLQAPTPSVLAPGLPTITYTSDFAPLTTGNGLAEAPEFFIFDDNFDASFRGRDLSTLEPGTYTIVMDALWGDTEQYVGMWYYFNLVVA